MSIRESNLAVLKGSLDAFIKTFNEQPPKSTLVEQDGDWNIIRDGYPMFKKGARADSDALMQAALRSPTRILFGKPSGMFSDDNANRGAKAGEFEYATQQYDDANKDVHVEDFQRAAMAELNRLGVELSEKPTRKNAYFAVSYGLGLGFHLRRMWEEFRPKNLIVLEADRDMLYHSLDVFDWAGLVEEIRREGAAITLILDEDARKMLARLNGAVQSDCVIGLDGLMSVKVSNHPVLNVVFSEFQSPKTANLAAYIGYIVDEYNMMKNSFRNLKSGTHRMLNFVRKRPALPALIVGSGPSLDANLEFVKRIRDRVILIASGSSLAVLLRNEITPDFQAVLERAKGNYERHVELSREFDLKQIVAIVTTTIWPGTAEFFKDAIYFLRPALSPLAVFCHDTNEILNGEGPQVTNTAFAFATRLGFKEIYLLGVDLGARDPARPRAERAWLTPGLKQRELTIPVRGNFGRTVFTDHALIQQRVTIENQIEAIRKAGGRVWNLGDGVRIHGAVGLRPDEVSLPNVEINVTEHVEELTNQFPIFHRDRFIADWESSQVRQSVGKMIRQLNEVVINAESWDFAVIKKLDQINRYVGKQVKQQYAPRLLRGSVLRICMFLQAVLTRVPPEREKEAFDAFKVLWEEMMRRLERESYELADELEAEDDYFRQHH